MCYAERASSPNGTEGVWNAVNVMIVRKPVLENEIYFSRIFQTPC